MVAALLLGLVVADLGGMNPGIMQQWLFHTDRVDPAVDHLVALELTCKQLYYWSVEQITLNIE